MHTAPIMHKAQTHEVMAAAADRSVSSFDKIGASLPPPWRLSGGQGGGGNTVHAHAPYLAGLFFGVGATNPKDGHEVVRAAARCGYMGSILFLEVVGPGGIILRSKPQEVGAAELQAGDTLAGYVQSRIEFYASEPADAVQTLVGEPLDIARSLVRLDFEPFAAQVEWRSEPSAQGNLLLVHYFQQEDELAKRRHMDPKAAAREMARIRRSSILPASIIFVAARILADGWAKGGKGLPSSGQGEALAGASSDSEHSENAKTPGFAEPGASVHSNQFRGQRETRTLTELDSKRVCAEPQAHAGSRGHPITEPRRYGTRPEDPPSFGLFAAGYP